MSPGATAARVYDALKAAILGGVYRPGDRLDPARLSDSFAASATPVRDALQRLHGERLVGNIRHEGFRLPLITEPDLRDLYGWSADLSGLLVRRLATTPAEPALPSEFTAAGYALATRLFFEALARRAGTREHRHAVASLNDRLEPVRRLEFYLVPDATADITDLSEGLNGHPAHLRAMLTRFHQRRMKAVPALAAALRPGEQRLGRR